MGGKQVGNRSVSECVGFERGLLLAGAHQTHSNTDRAWDKGMTKTHLLSHPPLLGSILHHKEPQCLDPSLDPKLSRYCSLANI